MVMQPAQQHMSLEQYLLLVNNSDQQYGSGQRFHLVSLDIEIEVRQLYRRLAIPAVVEQVAEENELKNKNDE